MNNRKLITADKLLLSIQNFCDKQRLKIDSNNEYQEYNRLVTEYSFGNKVDIDKVTRDITAFKNKVERYASKKYLTEQK